MSATAIYIYIYMVTFTINIPQMLAYTPYMDPMGMVIPRRFLLWQMVTRHRAYGLTRIFPPVAPLALWAQYLKDQIAWRVTGGIDGFWICLEDMTKVIPK